MFKRAALAIPVSAVALLAAASFAAADAKSDTKPEPKFISDAIEGDNSEIRLGNVALERGASTAVQEFGRTLINDHRKAKVGAVALAKKYEVKVSDDLTPEAKAELKKLLALSGTAFDAEFASYMVKDHTKDVADFEKQAKAKDDVGAYAEKTLPDLKKHLAMAEAIAGKSDASKTASDHAASSAPSASSSSSSSSAASSSSM